MKPHIQFKSFFCDFWEEDDDEIVYNMYKDNEDGCYIIPIAPQSIG